MSEEKVETEVKKTMGEVEESTEVVEETTEEKIVDESEPQRGKRKIAAYKIAKAKAQSIDTQEQIEQCMKNIDAAIDELNAKKQEFFSSTLQPSEKLLAGLDIEEIALEELPESKVELLDPNEGKVHIKELSSGRFKGLFYALITGVATLAVWCFAATKQLGIMINKDSKPDMEQLNKVLEWTSSQLGQGENANIGAASVIIAVLLVMWIVYTIIVSSRSSSNLKVATETEEAVGAYCTNKEECKQKMTLVREHIQNSTNSIGKYQVILQEQNAKLARAIYVEEVEGYEDLHANTKADIQITQQLIAKVKRLLESPIAEGGVLTSDSIDRLKSANKAVNDYIMNLYS